MEWISRAWASSQQPLRHRPGWRVAVIGSALASLLLMASPAWASEDDAEAGLDATAAAAAVEQDPLGGEDPLVFDDEEDALLDEEYDPLFDDDFELEDEPTGFPDPLEKPNRITLKFNQIVDRFIMDPVTRVYRFLLPEVMRRAINRSFDNVNSTQSLVNDVFQLEWKDASVTTARLVVNSTVGIGGLFDPAEKWGLEGHISDFGQTLAIAGAPSGFYFIIPLLGPTTVRDGVGLGVDAFFHPTFFLLGGADLLFFSGSAGLTERARHFEEIKALEESSIDFYAAMRSGYYQNRMSEIWSRREHRRPADAR